MAQIKEMNPVPIYSKIQYVVVSSTGFIAVMVKVWVIIKLYCTTRTNVITSRCN